MIWPYFLVAVVSFLAGAYFGILAYRVQLKDANDRGKVEIYVPPDTRIDNKTHNDPTAKIKVQK